jgi:Uma2 family endonuclease
MKNGLAIATRQIGPEHHGRRMSLKQFACVTGQPGYLYELDKAVIVVMDVPGVTHMRSVTEVRDRLIVYGRQNPGRINAITEGSSSAMRMPELQSERHPDISIYLSEPPSDDEQPWEFWTPDIVIEVVSQESRERDYVIKRAEYLEAGVRLYWIIDPLTRSATVLTRRTDTWDEQRLDASGKLTTRLLPGFELKLADLFAVLPPRRARARNGRPRRRR